jgi:hypothetical protein
VIALSTTLIKLIVYVVFPAVWTICMASVWVSLRPPGQAQK